MTISFEKKSIWILLFLLQPLLSFGQTATNAIDQARTESLALENYSISLNVSDISASIEFYEKLGFSPIAGLGGVDQNWVIVSNGTTKIGLFKGFFASNTITFNPSDGRTVYKQVTEGGIEPIFQIGMENESGPCTFSILDPDGNPILIDQH